MQVSIYTEKTELVKNQFDEVILPSVDGQITILNNHAPLLGILDNGEIILKKNKFKDIKIPVDKGFFNIKDNQLLVIITHTNLSNEELQKIKENAIKLADEKIIKEEISEEEFKKMKDTTLF